MKEKTYQEYQNGDIWNKSGKHIKVIVEYAPDYIVFVDEDLEIVYDLGKDYPNIPKDLPDVLSRITVLEDLSKTTIKGNELYQYKYELAQALARIIADRNFKAADNILNSANNKINVLAKEVLRITYLKASFITTCVVITLLIITIFAKSLFLYLLGNNNNIYYAILCSYAGALGAFISTFMRAKNYNANIDVSPTIHKYDGFLRIFYGLLAGTIIYAGLKANLIFSLANSTNSNYVIFFLCAISGASEAILPNIIKQADNKLSASDLFSILSKNGVLNAEKNGDADTETNSHTHHKIKQARE